MRIAIALCLFSAKWQEQPHDVVSPFRNSNQTMKAAPTGNVEQNRFDLICLGVSGCDQIALRSKRGFAEKPISGFAPGFFKSDPEFRSHTRHVGPARQEGNVEGLCECLALREFFFGFGPLAVMKMGGHNADFALLQQVKEGRAVRTAAISD